MKVTTCPTWGVEVLTDLETARSAYCVEMVTELVLLSGLGSKVSEEMMAVFVMEGGMDPAVGELTEAEIVSV